MAPIKDRIHQAMGRDVYREEAQVAQVEALRLAQVEALKAAQG